MIGLAATLAAMALAIIAIWMPKSLGMRPRLVWNVSASAPTGLYVVRSADNLTVTTFVIVYPPEPLATWLAEGDYVPRGMPLVKSVMALKGQAVCRVGPVITVDGLAVGVALKQDHRGRALPVWQGCQVIGANEVFLMNPDAPTSLDSRYFGPIPITAIAGRAVPLWTSKDG